MYEQEPGGVTSSLSGTCSQSEECMPAVPLAFSTTGGQDKAASAFYERLGLITSRKKNNPERSSSPSSSSGQLSRLDEVWGLCSAVQSWTCTIIYIVPLASRLRVLNTCHEKAFGLLYPVNQTGGCCLPAVVNHGSLPT
eukprot:scpid89005/ scgid15414/ 